MFVSIDTLFLHRYRSCIPKIQTSQCSFADFPSLVSTLSDSKWEIVSDSLQQVSPSSLSSQKDQVTNHMCGGDSRSHPGRVPWDTRTGNTSDTPVKTLQLTRL